MVRDEAGVVSGLLDERQMVTRLFPCPQNHRSWEERLIPHPSCMLQLSSCQGNFKVNRKHLCPLEIPMDENQNHVLRGRVCLCGNLRPALSAGPALGP